MRDALTIIRSDRRYLIVFGACLTQFTLRLGSSQRRSVVPFSGSQSTDLKKGPKADQHDETRTGPEHGRSTHSIRVATVGIGTILMATGGLTRHEIAFLAQRRLLNHCSGSCQFDYLLIRGSVYIRSQWSIDR